MSDQEPQATAEKDAYKKKCPRCGGPLPLSVIHAPQIEYNARTGRILSVSVTLFCVDDGYTERGVVIINQEPEWTELI